MNNIRKILIAITAFTFLLSLYVFSRFTVDDAFISWRYGKNLVDFGVWNYNPSNLDLTQAYTNPVYAILSIIPNYFGFDVVLFFKIFSTITLFGFLIWIYKIARGAILLPLMLVALPATIVHAYSGLETFLFVILAAALLIYLYEDQITKAASISIILFFVRPEAWLLVVLVPIYFLIAEPKIGLRDITSNPASYFKGLQLNPGKAFKAFAILALPLALYFLFHKTHFDSALPNTFYAKSGAKFNIRHFILFSIFIIPVFALIFCGKIKLPIFAATFFGAMVISYSTSNLQMNYAGRFAFHIFAPIYIFLIYFISKLDSEFYISTDPNFKKPTKVKYSTLAVAPLLIFLFAFARISDNTTLHLATYYPRAIQSHAELGKLISSISEKYGIRGFSLGDAGMAAYNSKINSLDNIGLGSSYVARKGIDDILLNNYNIDLIAFHARPDGIRLSDYNQQKIYGWSTSERFIEICDIYWQKDYTLRIYAKKPMPEIYELCKKSKSQNSRINTEMLKDNIYPPPWTFWRE